MKNLSYLFVAFIIFGCSKESDNTDQNQIDQSNPLYLDDNGITIKARDWANVNTVAELNGIEYLIVSEAMLRDMVNNREDVTKVVTSKVTNMSNLFYSTFNQLIDHWDVSNVTDMSDMFRQNSRFNQPLEHWDVSNVTDMSGMFDGTTYNYPIGNWDVSKVTDMSTMFLGSRYNQPLVTWDVSNAKDMTRMFGSSYFNQDIVSWDVSSVTDMAYMFSVSDDTSYNHDLSFWDVSSVVNCEGFAAGNIEWTLPKPSFSNCDPGF